MILRVFCNPVECSKLIMNCTDCFDFQGLECFQCSPGLVRSVDGKSCVSHCPAPQFVWLVDPHQPNSAQCAVCDPGKIPFPYSLRPGVTVCLNPICATSLWVFVGVGAAFVVLIAAAATWLDDHRLGQVVGAVIILQRFSVVGSAAVNQQNQHVPQDNQQPVYTLSPTTVAAFSYLSLLNLDIKALQDNCALVEAHPLRYHQVFLVLDRVRRLLCVCFRARRCIACDSASDPACAEERCDALCAFQAPRHACVHHSGLHRTSSHHDAVCAVIRMPGCSV